MNELIDKEQAIIRSGHGSFFGAFAQQVPATFLSFNRLLNVHNFDTIIELGTHDGGLSTLFALYCYLSRRPAQCPDLNEPILYKNKTHHRKGKSFYTFDNIERDTSAIAALRHLEAGFHCLDTLYNQTNIERIRGLIGAPGTTLLLCDGGSKKKEFELYGGALKKGDFIMLHDWARDEENFNANKVAGGWGFWESRWFDGAGENQQFGISGLCAQHHIIPVYAEEFDKVAWFCGIKT